jgi:hypothetical protein
MALNDADINESMAKDWAAIREKFAVEEPDPKAAEPETTEPVEPQESAETRPRDESGKFVKQEKADAKEDVQPVHDPADPGADPNVASEPLLTTKGAPVDITRAPSTWKPTARVDFAKLPESARAEIHRRETESAAGVAQLMPDAQLGKSMREVAAPYKALIDAEAGGRPELAFAELMKTAAILRMGTPQQKRDVVLSVARQYGVDLGLPQQQPNAQPGQQPQTFQDPRVDQLLQQLNAERQAAVQREQEALESSVTAWMNKVDENGNPLRPYLADVMSEMSALVPQIRQANPSLAHDDVLQRAYDTATWGNPEIRQLLLTQQAQGNEQARVADNQTRVRDAKRAASVNVPRRASLPSPGKPESIEKTIENTARELGLIT